MYLDLALALFFIISGSLFWLCILFIVFVLLLFAISSARVKVPENTDCPDEIDKEFEDIL